MTSRVPAVGIDIGGTKIAGALVDPEGRITHREQLPTPTDSARHILTTTAEMVTTLVTAAGSEVSGIGMACAGMVDGRAGRLWFSPNLPLRGIDVVEEVRRRTGYDVVLENDANAAAWGEYRFGAGKGCQDMLLAAVGTGVGGGCIVEDRLLRGAFGSGGEIGHITVDVSGPRCGCGNDGCLEVHASGRALERYARELIASGEAKGEGLRRRCGGAPERLTGQDITDLARAGDEGAVWLFTRLGTRLGEGLASVCAVVDPAVVVVGGGVAEAGALLIEPTRRAFEEHLLGRGARPAPTVTTATLGNDAGLVGAAALARESM